MRLGRRWRCTTKISASGQELGSGILWGLRLGFSGTPSELLPRELKCHFEPGSEGKIVYTLSSPRFVDYTLLKRWTVHELLREVATHKNPQFHALIDTGALVTGMSNKDVAGFLLREGLSGLEGCVYLDENDKQMVLLRTSHHPVSIKECGLPWDSRFTFYDQVHTTGIDIKQGLQVTAAITLGKDMTLRDYAQGAWRMRGLGIGQTLHLILIDEVIKLMQNVLPECGEDSANMAADVVAFLLKNSCGAEAMQEAQLIQQDLSTVWRRRAIKVLLEASQEASIEIETGNSKPEEAPLRMFNSMQGEPELLGQCAASFVERLDFSVSPDYEPGKAIAEVVEAAWQDEAHGPLLEKVSPAIGSGDYEKAFQEYSALKEHAKQIAEAAKSGPGLGSEMVREQEQEQEQQKEVEKEAEVQTGRERDHELPCVPAGRS